MFRIFRRRSQARTADPPQVNRQNYHVYTRQHDQVVDAASLLRQCGLTFVAREAKEEFRRQMAARMSALTTRSLVLKDQTPKQLPTDASLLITVLIDLSGSVKGASAQLAALAAQAVAAFADCFAARLEVLGFTTVDWQGRPVREIWLHQGRPACPGRLCALRHVVFRAFDDPQPPDLDLLFVGDFFFRENVDGEAIDWALTR